MTASTINVQNQVTHFQNKVKREYVRGGRFGPFIGNDENSVIQTNRDIKKVSLPLIAKLSGQGVKGSAQLGGNEEALANYAQEMQPTYFRNGVLIDNEEQDKSEFDLFTEARPALMNWAMELKRDQMIQGLGAIQAGGTYYNYGGAEGAFGSTAASAANMDTWNTENPDRILYGNALGNRIAGDHTGSLANIDNAADKLTPNVIRLAKRQAERARPLIRPIMLKSDEPWYVMFIDSLGYRDLSADPEMQQANREIRPRVPMDNPIFAGGDLLMDGVIIKRVPDIDRFIDGDGTGNQWDGVWGANATGDGLDNGGNLGTRVGAGFMCGAQALGFLIGRLPSFKRRKEDDYEHLNGVGITKKHDVKKTFYNNKQHGMVTMFYSAIGDA